MKTTISKCLLGLVVALILGLSATIVLISSKSNAYALETNQYYDMIYDNSQSNLGLQFGDYYNNEYYLNYFKIDGNDYFLDYQGRVYILYYLNKFYSYNGSTYERAFTRDIIQNSYTFFFSTPMFYDGYNDIENDEQHQYSIDYVSNDAYVYLSLISSQYDVNVGNNYSSISSQITSMIDGNLLNRYRVLGADAEGQMYNMYYSSSNPIDTLFNLNYNEPYWYLLIECSQGYCDMIYYIGDELFASSGSYNYPSIYFSSVKQEAPIIMDNVIGYSQAELDEIVRRELQDYIQGDGYRVYLNALDEGRQQGYDDGYRDGKRDGINETTSGFEQYENVLTTSWSSATSLLNTPVFGNLTILHLILIPLVLGVLLIILKLIRG